jgi:glutamate-1-semialdehyde 2,1-aminomutase
MTTKLSLDIFQKSEQYLPWGSSTCSKKAKFTPEEPAVIVRGKGCRVWDADDNEYIDFRNGLGPVTLGYCYPRMNEAIVDQLNDGIVFGYPHPLEGEVAELLCSIIPCAEQARFLKTGGEAVAATIKIARAATGRDEIIQIGYNGWLNSVGAGASQLPNQHAEAPPLGVPECVAGLFHVCSWNNCEAVDSAFKRRSGRVAAVVVACDYRQIEAAAEFLPFLRKITKDHGALLILDEIVTGFRLAIGGAHEYFNVNPDLAVFAKGMANGMPISAYLGKRRYMKLLDKCIVSSTYGGEALSLAATKAVIDVYLKENVIDHLWKIGEKMWGGLNQLFLDNGFETHLTGAWSCPTFVVPANEKSVFERFLRISSLNGVALYGNVGYVNFSHKKQDIDEVLERLQNAIKEI